MIKDVLNKKYGRLTPLGERTKPKPKKRTLLCKCDCGTVKEFKLDDLRNGTPPTQSCGCLSIETFRKMARKNNKRFIGNGNPNYRHGDTRTRFHTIFMGIVGRCNIKSFSNYKYYGAKGIKCFWKTYEDFKKDMYPSYMRHIKKYGEKQTTIDRLNNKEGYCKYNCKWATMLQQRHNRSDSI